MSEISDLATAFEARSKQRASDTTTAVQSALEAHENALRQCLSDEQKRIETAIRAHSRRMGWLVARSWIVGVLTILATIAAASGVLWWQAGEIIERTETLAPLPDAALTRCGEAKRLCVQINPDAGTYTNDAGGTFAVLAGE